jgi:FkbM family methyltransferase
MAMKGKWIPNLLKRSLDGSLTHSEAFEFALWRIGGKNSPLRIEGLLFKEVDRILWGIISNIFINREYTPRGFNIGPNDVIIDIGAHKGAFVGFASNRTKNLITAIEPDPQNFERLEGFIHDNKIENVELKRVAIDAVSGETTLYQAQSSSRHTIMGADQLSGDRLVKTIKVKAITLSDLLSPFETVDFLKMDCEGPEVNILSIVDEETLRKVKRLVAEIHWIGRKSSLEVLKERLAQIYNNIVFVKTSTDLGLIYASFDKEDSD